MLITTFNHGGKVVVSNFGHGFVFIITFGKGYVFTILFAHGDYVFIFTNDRNGGPEGPGRLRVACFEYSYNCQSWVYVFTTVVRS